VKFINLRDRTAFCILGEHHGLATLPPASAPLERVLSVLVIVIAPVQLAPSIEGLSRPRRPENGQTNEWMDSLEDCVVQIRIRWPTDWSRLREHEPNHADDDLGDSMATDAVSLRRREDAQEPTDV
jgi:hypothetical protein